jgi:hypothetical protein
MLNRIREFHTSRKIGPFLLLVSCIILLAFVIAVGVF